METNSNNIPEITVCDLVNQLKNLYVKATKAGIDYKKLPTPFLWGPAGIGKSEGIYQLAEALEKETLKKVIVTDIRLLLFSPVDLHGIPVADEGRRFAKWLMPSVFNMDSSEDIINILFLDELSAAPQSVQAAAYQMCLDRRVGEHKLADNCIIIAAGNRTTDMSVSYKMPKALCNRLLHFLIKVDFASWKEWAIKNDVDSRVIGYLSFDNSRLFVFPNSSDLAYPTPRSWNFVSNLLKTTELPPEEIHDLIASAVGVDSAVEFESWCKMLGKLPKIDDIIKGQCLTYPTGYDVYYALVSSLTSAVISRKDSLSDTEFENVCVYAERFPLEFAVTFFRELNMIDELKGRLMKCAALSRWLIKNKKSL